VSPIHGQAATHLSSRLAKWDGQAILHSDAGLHVSVELALRFLDIAEETTGAIVATAIADGIYEAITGDGTSRRARNIRAATDGLAALAAAPPLFPASWHRPTGESGPG
jgi:hypothetical protein